MRLWIAIPRPSYTRDSENLNRRPLSVLIASRWYMGCLAMCSSPVRLLFAAMILPLACLSNFGELFNPHETLRFSSKTLPLLQPPETRFSDNPLSFASDVWSLACTIWEIFGQRPLFDAFFPNCRPCYCRSRGPRHTPSRVVGKVE